MTGGRPPSTSGCDDYLSDRPRPALAALRQRGRLRLLSAIFVGVSGLVALLAGVAPAVLGELIELSASPNPASLLAGRAVLVQTGLVLLVTARMLARG